MLWYGGSIAEAVNLSKEKNAIFVVFVEGENELSTELAATLEHQDVAARLANERNFLAVKLSSGSQNYTHFAQIYQFVPVPSLFFIGRNGTPLEVVCAGVEPSNLAGRIDRIMAEHFKDKPPTIEPSTSGLSVKQQTNAFLQSEAAPAIVTPTEAPSSSQAESSKNLVAEEASGPTAAKVSKPDDNYEVVCDGDVCVRKPKSDEAGPSVQPRTPDGPSTEQLVQEAAPPESPQDVTERIDRAKELLEMRRLEKEQKEKEAERQKELERRSQGQGAAELKRWQAEQEMKQLQEERKREKLENTRARQHILDQIAQDRAERRAREAPAPATVAPPVPAHTGDAVSHARIQFKLPDGSSHTAQFPADETLGQLQDYVANNLQVPSGTFSLWTAFPRRELTEAGATLRGLELAPSAAVLVLSRAPSPAAPPALISTRVFLYGLFCSLILDPANSVWVWIQQRFLGRPPPRSSTSARSPASPPRQDSGPLRYRNTNVHRLAGDPSDDENNTWNGNSTQQM